MANFRYLALTLCLLTPFVSFPAVSDMIDTSGLDPWEGCALCHGLYGDSAMAKFPKLAGQKREYLLLQVNNFRSQKRMNDGGQMQSIVNELTLEQLTEAVEWFVKQPDPKPSSESLSETERLAIDEFINPELVTSSAFACARCHNPSDTYAPVIRSQHSAYLEKQLGDFKYKRRLSDLFDHEFLEQVDDNKLRWLADFFASSPR